MPNIFANIKSDRTDFNTYLDSLPDKQREELLARHERIGLIAPRKDGILTEIGQTAAGETLRLGESIGSTIEESTGYSGMKDYFAQRRALNRQYEPYEGYKAFSLNPTDIARTVTSGVVQSTGALLATAAGAAAGGAAGGLAAGTSVMFSQVYGDRVKEYREIMPEQDEGVVKGLAFLSALGESAIETLVGPEQIAAKIGSQLSARKLVGEAVKETTQSLAKRIGKEAAKNAVTEGAEEVSQDMWDRLVKKLGGVDVKMPSWDEASETFAGGAWSGAFLGGLGGAMEGAGRRNAQRAIYGAEASAPASAEEDAKNNAQTPSSVGLNGGMQNIGSAVSETAVSETDVKNAGKTMSEALLDEFGVKHRRMTDDEISKEGYGYVMRDGEKVYTNGFYSREANEIVINPLNDGEVFTAGHEFKHWIDANHSDLGAVLDGIMDEQFNELGEQGGENAPAPDEFKADIMGYLLKDRTALHDMAVKAEQRQAGFGEKFLHAVIEFCKKVMAFAKGNNTIPEAEKYFNDYKAVRDTATTALAELKQRVNGQRNAANNAAMNTDVSQMERAAGNYVSIDELENAVREYEHDKDALRLAGRFIRVSDIQKAIAKYEIGNMTEADWNDAVNNSKDKVALRGVLNKLSADDLNKAAEDYYRVKEEQNTSTPESTVNTPADNVFPVNTHAPTLKDSLQVEEDKAKSEDKGASEDSREPIENREPIDIEPEINRTLPGSKERARFIGDLKDGEYVFGGMKLRKKTVRGALVYEISDSKGQIGEYSQAGALEIIDAFEQYENHRIDGLKKPVVKDNLTTEKENVQKTEKVETPKNIESESEDQIANGIGSSITDVIYMNASMNEKQAKLSAIAKKYGLSIKEVQEITESYIVTIARRINSENISDEEKYNKLISLYEKQPVMSKRTSTSIINQAYSTPVPMAWLLGKRIGINGKTVYEPTAGTGMLTVAGDPSTIDVNEIDIVRKKILSSEGFHRVTSEDASKSRPNRKYDRVIMNPPFGAGKETKFGNFNLTKLDHIIAARALETMKDNGKAAIIVGANTEGRDGTGKTNFSDFVFMNYLYSNFNVTDNYIVSGELYRKQGASYPVRIITVSGKRISNGDISVPKNIEIIDNWSTLYSKLKGETENAVSEKERNSDELSGNSAGQQTSNPANGRGRTSGDKGSLGKNRGDSSEGKSGRSGRTGEVDQRESESERGMGDGKSEGRVISVSPGEIDHRASGMDKGTVPVSESNRESGSKTENNHDTGRRGESGRSGESTGAVRGNALPDGRTGRNLVTGEQRGELNNEYVPASNSTSKMDVVVPKFMAQQTESALRRLKEKVGDVDKFVKDELRYNSEEELYNALSDAQIDAVAQIIESIQNGDGFIIGDQTGIGKGRQCAAVIRWAQKHNIFPVFFTKDQNLFKNMYFDGKDIGSTFKPFILASSGDKANITNDEGEVIVGLPKNQSNAMNDVLDGKDNYDCIFTSYSQFQKEGKQSEFIRNLTRSRKCIVILDESHKAAGEPKLSGMPPPCQCRRMYYRIPKMRQSIFHDA